MNDYQLLAINAAKEAGAIIEMYDKKRLAYIKYLTGSGALYRKDGPAFEEWYPNGQQAISSWAIYSQHRVGGPSHQEWYPDGQRKILAYHIQDQLNHPLNEPAFQKWYSNGQLKIKEYYNYGVPHRDQGPTSMSYYKNGNPRSIQYIVHGRNHRPVKEGPSLITYDKNNAIIDCNYQEQWQGTYGSDDEVTLQIQTLFTAIHHIKSMRHQPPHWQSFSDGDLIFGISFVSYKGYVVPLYQKTQPHSLYLFKQCSRSDILRHLTRQAKDRQRWLMRTSL